MGKYQTTQQIQHYEIGFKKTSENKVFDIQFFDENSTENEKINFEATIASKNKTPSKKKPKSSKKLLKKPKVQNKLLETQRFMRGF